MKTHIPSLTRVLVGALAFSLATVVAHAASPASARLDALQAAVNALPEATAESKLKKAALVWALEDARDSEESGLTADVELLLRDVGVMLSQDIGKALTAPPNLFPSLTEYQVTQFVPAGQLERKGHKSDRTAQAFLLEGRFKKGPEGDIISTPDGGWVAIRVAYEAEKLAMTLCHPESPYAGDPRLVAPMLRRFANAYCYMRPDNPKRLADFGPTPPLSQMYLLLKTVYPDLIPPSRQAAWEAAIRLNCDTILKSREEVFATAQPGTAYVNCDIKYISGLAYAGELFDDARYRKAAVDGLRLISTAIYPDGASAYIDWQNEVFTYHAILVTELARIAQVTRDPLPLDLLKRTANYYPLSFVMVNDTRGVAEFSTASSWKQNWNGAVPGEAAMLVERITGVKQAVPSTENHIVFDRNIDGPRGRFGNFAFVGTGRNLHNDSRGKSTYAGAMVFAKDDLSAALNLAGTEVTPKPGDTSRALYNLAQDEYNATTVTRDFATLSTSHRLSRYRGKPESWQGRQLWLFTPTRMVGWVQVESLADQTAAGVAGALELVAAPTARQGIESLGQDGFKNGRLVVHIKSHDYAAITADSAPAKFTRIRLVDTAPGQDAPALRPFPKGTTRFYLAELRAEDASPAEDVHLLELARGLAGFVVKEKGRTYCVVFNSSDQTQVWRMPATQTPARLYRDGERYRPAWIGREGREEMDSGGASLTPSQIKEGISIPAFSHIIVLSSP